MLVYTKRTTYRVGLALHLLEELAERLLILLAVSCNAIHEQEREYVRNERHMPSP